MANFIAKPPLGTQLNPYHPLSQGLTLALPLNEGGGTKCFDATGRNAPSVLTNGPTWDPRGGVLFDGSTEHILGPNGGDVLSGNGSIVFQYTQTNIPSSYYYWFALDDDYLEFSFYGAKAGNSASGYIDDKVAWSDQLAGFDITAYKFSTWVLTWDDTKDKSNGHLSGVANALSDSPGFSWDSAGVAAHNLCIGGRKTGADRHAGGIIHCFYVYDRVLSVSDAVLLTIDPYCMFRPIIDIPYFWQLHYEAPAGGDSLLHYMYHYMHHTG